MTSEEALNFLETHGVILESARGPVPSLAAAVAGDDFRGGWWGHPKGNEIFLLTRAVRRSPDVLVCRLVQGKITYVHRRLWPALVRLGEELPPERLAAVEEIHTASGSHEVRETPYPDWVPPEIVEEAKGLSRNEAVAELGPEFGYSR